MSSLRHVLALALVSAAVVLGGAPACSQQTEGERCDSAKAGDADCESGLTCIVAKNLVNGGGADRCCPEAGEETDKRCTRGTLNTGTGGSSTGGSSTGGSSTGGSSTGGSSAGGSSTGGSASGSPAESEAGAAGSPVEASAGAGGAG